MAETILNIAAEEILGKLISLATDLIGLAWGFKEHIEEAMCYGWHFSLLRRKGPFWIENSLMKNGE